MVLLQPTSSHFLVRALKCGKLQCFQQQYLGRSVGVRRGLLLDDAGEWCVDKVDFPANGFNDGDCDFAAAAELMDLVGDFNTAVGARVVAAADDVAADAAVPVFRFLRGGALDDFIPAADSAAGGFRFLGIAMWAVRVVKLWGRDDIDE